MARASTKGTDAQVYEDGGKNNEDLRCAIWPYLIVLQLFSSFSATSEKGRNVLDALLGYYADLDEELGGFLLSVFYRALYRLQNIAQARPEFALHQRKRPALKPQTPHLQPHHPSSPSSPALKALALTFLYSPTLMATSPWLWNILRAPATYCALRPTPRQAGLRTSFTTLKLSRLVTWISIRRMKSYKL